jgi:putative endonuclease
MKSARKQLGSMGEQLAADRLVQKGMEILARNWHCAQGEIDIIARQGETLIFVEVKTRRGRAAGTPEQGVDVRKQRLLCQSAQCYLQSIGWEGDVRLDVVAVELTSNGRLLRVTHWPDAIECWDLWTDETWF